MSKYLPALGGIAIIALLTQANESPILDQGIVITLPIWIWLAIAALTVPLAINAWRWAQTNGHKLIIPLILFLLGVILYTGAQP